MLGEILDATQGAIEVSRGLTVSEGVAFQASPVDVALELSIVFSPKEMAAATTTLEEVPVALELVTGNIDAGKCVP